GVAMASTNVIDNPVVGNSLTSQISQMLQLVTLETKLRHQQSLNELQQLAKITARMLIKLNKQQQLELFNNAKSRALADYRDITALTSEAKMAAQNNGNFYSYALNSNKLGHLLQQVVYKLDDLDYLGQLQTGKLFNNINNSELPFLSSEIGDTRGTAEPAIGQVLMLELLATYHNCNISDIPELKQHNIYNPINSPNIQTTDLKNPELTAKFRHINWFYRDNNSPRAGELLFTTMGYVFDGSRNDSRYLNKLWAAEDCSSATHKWLKATKPFSTHHMEYFAKFGAKPLVREELPKLQDYEYAEFDDYVQSVSESLKVKADLAQPEPGDVFMYVRYNLELAPRKDQMKHRKGGHVGVVLSVTDGGSTINYISYNRDLESKAMEGIGLASFKINENSDCNYHLFTPVSVNQELLATYQHLKITAGNGSQE
ncbi:MAG: hypothetical protein AAF153_01245, partial [Pseudomonadota bacterium]